MTDHKEDEIEKDELTGEGLEEVVRLPGQKKEAQKADEKANEKTNYVGRLLTEDEWHTTYVGPLRNGGIKRLPIMWIGKLASGFYWYYTKGGCQSVPKEHLVNVIVEQYKNGHDNTEQDKKELNIIFKYLESNGHIKTTKDNRIKLRGNLELTFRGEISEDKEEKDSFQEKAMADYTLQTPQVQSPQTQGYTPQIKESRIPEKKSRWAVKAALITLLGLSLLTAYLNKENITPSINTVKNYLGAGK